MAMCSQTASALIYSLGCVRLRDGALRRAQAWAVTGPLGHFWSASADIVVLWARYGWSRVVSRGPGAPARRRRRS